LKVGSGTRGRWSAWWPQAWFYLVCGGALVYLVVQGWVATVLMLVLAELYQAGRPAGMLAAAAYPVALASTSAAIVAWMILKARGSGRLKTRLRVYATRSLEKTFRRGISRASARPWLAVVSGLGLIGLGLIAPYALRHVRKVHAVRLERAYLHLRETEHTLRLLPAPGEHPLRREFVDALEQLTAEIRIAVSRRELPDASPALARCFALEDRPDGFSSAVARLRPHLEAYERDRTGLRITTLMTWLDPDHPAFDPDRPNWGSILIGLAFLLPGALHLCSRRVPVRSRVWLASVDAVGHTEARLARGGERVDAELDRFKDLCDVVAAAHGGWRVAWAGDGGIFVFPLRGLRPGPADRALPFALDLRRAARSRRAAEPEEYTPDARIAVGADAIALIRRPEDWHSDELNRICKTRAPGVLVTDSARVLIPSPSRYEIRPLEETRLMHSVSEEGPPPA
jgi:class 3 adenylate cyclase